MSIKCPKCAVENSDGAKFCKNCGQNLTLLANSAPSVAVADRICGECGTPNSSVAKFCKLCGASVAAPAAPSVAPKPALAPAPAAPPLPEADPEATIRPTLVQAGTATPSQITDFDAAIKQLTAPIKLKAADPVVPETTGQRENQKPTRYLLWGGIAAACVAMAGATYWYASQPNPTGASVETPARRSAPAPGPTPAPIPDPVPAPMPEPAPAFEPSPTPVPAPDIVEAPRATPLKPIEPKPERKKVPPKVRPVPLPAPAPVPEPVRQESMTTLPTRPAPQPALPIGPSSPREACGGRIFLALAMCMQEQCETPKFRNHAQCVELRQQRQAIEDRNNNR